MFQKLILYLQLSRQLPEFALQEFYTHSTSVINQCFYYNFNAFLSKMTANFFEDIDVLTNLL